MAKQQLQRVEGTFDYYKRLDKESIYELQKIDCNCNNCGHFVRDIAKTQALNNNEQIVACKIHYGQCAKLNKAVGEIANIALLHTQSCFEHRSDLKKLAPIQQ